MRKKGSANREGINFVLSQIKPYDFPLEEKREIIRETIQKARRGDQEAAALLIRGGIRNIVKVATRYLRFFKSYTLMDLVQEGGIGIIKAIEKYKISSNLSFYFYATLWIRAMILQALERSDKAVKIPSNIVNQKVIRLLSKLSDESEGCLSFDEMAKGTRMTKQRILWLWRALQMNRAISMELLLDSNNPDSESLKNLLVSDALTPEEEIIRKDARKKTLETLAWLTPREKIILCQRFGINLKEDEETLGKLGESFGITRERVRQIEAGAVKKLYAKLSRVRKKSLSDYF